jgi:hypothetical protein
MILLQLPQATKTAGEAAGNVTRLSSDDPLFSLLWFLVLVLGICLVALIIWVIRYVSIQSTKLQEGSNLITSPMKEAYEKVLLERNAAHAIEIKGNETMHQFEKAALYKQLEDERNDRKLLTQQAQNAYRELSEIVTPFTDSNKKLADRVHDMERALNILINFNGRDKSMGGS